MYAPNRTGQRFGALKVVMRDDNRPPPGAWWVCACDCTGYRSVVERKLLSGEVGDECVRCEVRRQIEMKVKYSRPSIKPLT